MVAAVYLFYLHDRGWVPHDEGTLAHSAERVLQGELPHRDFDDPYTGGLAWLHALAFRVWGVNLLALRRLLFFVSLLFVPAVYWLASQESRPMVAGLVTALCVAWSVPNYFASLPSWYNLFFATFGTIALLRHGKTGQRRWLVAAGLCGGLSFLIKSVGLFYVAASLLYLVYREQNLALAKGQSGRAAGFRIFTATGLVLFGGLLIAFVVRWPLSSYGVFVQPIEEAVMELVHFVLPGVALCGFLLWNEWRTPSLRTRKGRLRWRVLWGLLLPFGAGVIAPIGLFLIPYVMSDSISAWYVGVFIRPQSRFQSSVYPLPGAITLAASLPIAALLFGAGVPRNLGVPRWLVATIVLAGGLILIFGAQEQVYRGVWYTLRPIVPLVTLAGCWILASVRADILEPSRRQSVFLLLAMGAMVSMVQFPYAFGIYFLYTAPMVILAVHGVIGCRRSTSTRLPLCFCVFYLLFAVCWLNRSYHRDIGGRFTKGYYDHTLDLERGGLQISAPMACLYQRLVTEVNRRAPAGAYIYAAPDCPEVYFLTNRRNPTRVFYDFMDDDFWTDPPGHSRRIMQMLEHRDVNVVVFRWNPEFTPGMRTDLVQTLMARYPQRVDLPLFDFDQEPVFSVLWRNGEVMDRPGDLPPSLPGKG